MPINPALLIAAPMLQDYLVDKDSGLPLTAGIVTCYQDNSRTTLKNWYYQTGTPGNYTYVTLPNPMTLSAVGTIVDVNGNDTIPFFYPYSEDDNQTVQTYYITVVNSNLEAQFVRQNFPFIAQTPTTSGVPTLKQYIVNNSFWRNIGSANVGTLKNTFTQNGATYYYLTIAPSQHDGFAFPDINYIKSTNGATETITFTKFAEGTNPLMGDVTPEFYINHNCTGAQTGETLKVYQFPISLHVKQLESVPSCITIQAQNAGGVGSTITVSILQHLGTGVTSTFPPTPLANGTLTLNPNWEKFTVPFTFPSAAAAALGAGQDDAYYLQVGIPLSTTCNINFTLPSLYLSDSIANLSSNNFTTYDEIDTVINSPRTSDVRMSLNSFYFFGWIPMNNGVIALDNPMGGTNYARFNADTWQLYNSLWTVAQPYDSGSNFNPLCQMFTSAGAATNFGMTAYADFTANKALSLTKQFGQVLAGTVPISALLSPQVQAITASNSAGTLLLTVTSAASYFIGQPVTFTTTGTLPGNIVTNAVYYISNLTGTTFNVCTTFANALTNTSPVAWSSAGSGSSANVNQNGIPIGEAQHILSVAELASHSHTIQQSATSGGQTAPLGGVGTAGSITNTGNTGGGLGHNNIQPTTFMNVYIKM